MILHQEFNLANDNLEERLAKLIHAVKDTVKLKEIKVSIKLHFQKLFSLSKGIVGL